MIQKYSATKKENFLLLKMFLMVVLCWPCLNQAQSRTSDLAVDKDPRGPFDVTICSQNLEFYGALSAIQNTKPEFTATELEEKEDSLVQRFLTVRCDIIAVQEILGDTEDAAQKALESLAKALRKKTGRVFDAKVGESLDPHMRPGYLFARDKADLLTSTSYAKVELPKFDPTEKPRIFSRGPLELQLRVRGKEGASSKIINLVNFHFKSKRGAANDPAGLDYETLRMQMSEALRRIIENRLGASFKKGSSILVALGDRNSNFDVASAKILEGTLTLKQFQAGGVCRLSKRGVALCQVGAAQPQKLFSILLGDPQTKMIRGTFQFEKVYSWLDDILMPAESLPYAWQDYDSEGDYDSGVVFEPKDASDHSMVWVRLNW